MRLQLDRARPEGGFEQGAHVVIQIHLDALCIRCKARPPMGAGRARSGFAGRNQEAN